MCVRMCVCFCVCTCVFVCAIADTGTFTYFSNISQKIRWKCYMVLLLFENYSTEWTKNTKKCSKQRDGQLSLE